MIFSQDGNIPALYVNRGAVRNHTTDANAPLGRPGRLVQAVPANWSLRSGRHGDSVCHARIAHTDHQVKEPTTPRPGETLLGERFLGQGWVWRMPALPLVSGNTGASRPRPARWGKVVRVLRAYPADDGVSRHLGSSNAGDGTPRSAARPSSRGRAGRPAGQEEIERRAEPVDVAPRIHLAAPGVLGSDVRDFLRVFLRVDPPGHAGPRVLEHVR